MSRVDDTVSSHHLLAPWSSLGVKPVWRISLHLLRYATVACVALAAGFAALDERPGIAIVGLGHLFESYASGWPLVCSDRMVVTPSLSSYGDGSGEHRTIEPSAITFNVIVFFAIVGSSFFVAHRLWPLIRFRQFSLSALFVLIVVVAVLAVLLRWENDVIIPDVNSDYYPITVYPWWIFFPVLYGIACFVVVSCLAMGGLMRRVARRLPWVSRKAPSEPFSA